MRIKSSSKVRTSVARFAILAMVGLMLASPMTPATQGQSLDDIKAIRQLGRELLIQRKREEKLIASGAKRRLEISKLFKELSQPKIGAAKFRQLGSELLGYGAEPASRLTAMIEKDFKSRRSHYLEQFHRTAVKVVHSRGNRQAEQEIVKLRALILGLPKDGLTKDEIRQQADPAMARLVKLLSVERGTVYQTDDALRATRGELIERLSIWHKAQVVLKREQATARRAKSGRPPSDALASVPSAMPSPGAFGDELDYLENFASYVATPMAAQSREVMLQNFRLLKKLDPEESKGIVKLNVMRVQLGLNALALDMKLVETGRDHSKDMKEKKFFAHESPVPGKKSPWDRAKRFGTTASAENIFMGRATGDAAITAWWYSPGHHTNMLNPGHRRVGLGRHGVHWTQLFGR